jgi:RimK family alpha-L-glutamate ligase
MPRSAPRLVLARGQRKPLVALIIDQFDWHARSLSRALASSGIEVARVRLDACGFDTQSQHGLALNGLGDRLPDAAIVRTVPGGTFEAVTLRLGVLHALRERGVMVWNDARAVERCVDKSTTSFLLQRAGIPTPATWTVQSYEAARAIVERETSHGPLVLKPLFGSQGRGLKLISGPEDLPEPGTVAGVYYLQRYIGVEQNGFRDFRLLVSRGRVVSAMMRHAPTWITNIKRGGRPVAAAVGPEAEDLAIRATAAMGADFAGVDILYDADRRPMVLEVNSMPAWSGLQKVTRGNIAAVIVGDLVAALRARGLAEAAG